jgi:phosphatidylinositol alpha-mannosyltransferase
MKIALVTPYDYPYPGGVTEHVRHLDREFRARGHQVRIIAPSSLPQGALPPNVIRVNGGVVPVSANGSTARLALSPLAYEHIRHILKAEAFDVVHVHEPAVPLLSLAALAHANAVTVGTFHALREQDGAGGLVYPLAMWPILEWLDGRIFVSKPLRDSVAGFFDGESRIIPNGVDTAEFGGPDVHPIEAFNDGRPNLLFVGRMEARKGFRHLLRAYPYVKQAAPEVRLLVVGAYDEEETASFRRYARRYRLGDIHFVGRVSPEDLPRYYQTAAVFCAPSTGSESFGIVLLEAMAAGVPVVASKIAGYASVLADGITGCLTEPGDERKLARAITALLRDPDARRRMGEAGRAAAQAYDWRVVAPRVLAYYKELIATRPTHRTPSHEDRLNRIADMLRQGTDIQFKDNYHLEFGPEGPHLRGWGQLAIGGKVIFRLGQE